jgi:CSLREA domain-containing protein
MPSIYTVTTTADTSNPNDGLISLREAIALANANAGNDQINFNLSGGTNPYEIYLTSALPDIINASTTLPGGGTAGSITISGPGASSLIINGDQGNYSIFKVNTGGNLTISGVTVTGANLSGSGGAFSNSGALNIYSSTISGNSVTGNGGGLAVPSA